MALHIPGFISLFHTFLLKVSLAEKYNRQNTQNHQKHIRLNSCKKKHHNDCCDCIHHKIKNDRRCQCFYLRHIVHHGRKFFADTTVAQISPIKPVHVLQALILVFDVRSLPHFIVQFLNANPQYHVQECKSQNYTYICKNISSVIFRNRLIHYLDDIDGGNQYAYYFYCG